MKLGRTFGGIALIVIGTVYLLSSLGFLEITKGVIGALVLVGVGLMLVFAALTDDSPQMKRKHSQVIFRENATEAEVSIQYITGELLIDTISAPDAVMVVHSATDLTEKTILRGDRIQVELETNLKSCFHLLLPWTWFDARYNRWHLALAQDIPLDLRLECGAAKADLNLKKALLKELHIEIGASETRVELPKNAGNTRVKIEAGAASIELHVPEGVAARLQVESSVSSIDIDEHRFPRQGKYYQSADYDVAANKADIRVEMGAGSLKVY